MAREIPPSAPRLMPVAPSANIEGGSGARCGKCKQPMEGVVVFGQEDFICTNQNCPDGEAIAKALATLPDADTL